MDINKIIETFSEEKEVEKEIQDRIKELNDNPIYKEIQELRVKQDDLTLKRIHLNKEIIKQMREKNIKELVDWDFKTTIATTSENWEEIEYLDIQKVNK